ncbi:MAG: toll/interleukin-1 receptor domain-containing protein [Bacteroidota bacterium]
MEKIKHQGPSSIDFHTLKNSPNLPIEFLRGIGLPDIYIDYLPDFYDLEPIKMYSSFLSHSKANVEFAEKLYYALQKKGVRVWYDEKQMKPGDKIHRAIVDGINTYDKMILVCSKESLNSWWVETEFENIMNKEWQYQKDNETFQSLLIPITIDVAVFNGNCPKHLETKIQSYKIGDFRNWQDETAFNEALNKLVAALNADRNDHPPIPKL